MLAKVSPPLLTVPKLLTIFIKLCIFHYHDKQTVINKTSGGKYLKDFIKENISLTIQFILRVQQVLALNQKLINILFYMLMLALVIRIDSNKA